MMWGWDVMFGIGGIFMMFFMLLITLLFFGLIIAGIAFAVRAFSGAPMGPGVRPESKDTALEILKERYAKGEIDAAEYEEKKRQLVS